MNNKDFVQVGCKSKWLRELVVGKRTYSSAYAQAYKETTAEVHLLGSLLASVYVRTHSSCIPYERTYSLLASVYVRTFDVVGDQMCFHRASPSS